MTTGSSAAIGDWQIGQDEPALARFEGMEASTWASNVRAMPFLHCGQRNARLAVSSGKRIFAPHGQVTMRRVGGHGVPRLR